MQGRIRDHNGCRPVPPPQIHPPNDKVPHPNSDGRPKPAAISSQEADTGQMAAWRDGVSWENWPAGPPTLSPSSHLGWTAAISQGALGFTNGKEHMIQRMSRVADGQHKDEGILFPDGNFSKGHSQKNEGGGGSYSVCGPTVRRI